MILLIVSLAWRSANAPRGLNGERQLKVSRKVESARAFVLPLVILGCMKIALFLAMLERRVEKLLLRM